MVVVSKVVELYSLFVVVKGLAHVVPFILIGICSSCLARLPLGFGCGFFLDGVLKIPSLIMCCCSSSSLDGVGSGPKCSLHAKSIGLVYGRVSYMSIGGTDPSRVVASCRCACELVGGLNDIDFMLVAVILMSSWSGSPSSPVPSRSSCCDEFVLSPLGLLLGLS